MGWPAGRGAICRNFAVHLSNVWRVCKWMKRTSDPRNYSIPLAMVVLSGLLHANFEDWLFAVGAYPSIYFWFFAFVLADLVAANAAVQVPHAVPGWPAPWPESSELSRPTTRCPIDDPIVYQRPRRERSAEADLSSQCNSALSRQEDAETTVALNSALHAEFGELPRITLVKAAEGSGALGRFVREQTELPKMIHHSGAQVLISAGNFALWNSPVPQILLSRNSLYTSDDFLRDVRVGKITRFGSIRS